MTRPAQQSWLIGLSRALDLLAMTVEEIES